MNTMEVEGSQPPVQENGDTSQVEQAPNREHEGALPTSSSANDTGAARPPSLRGSGDASNIGTDPSSAPLGPTIAARRPAPPPQRPSGMSVDIAAKMKAFSMSRQGPAPNRNPSAQNINAPNAVGNAFQRSPAPQSPGGVAGGMSNMQSPPGVNRPPQMSGAPRPGGARGPMVGLAAKRGLKPGGMKLSDATKPPGANEEKEKQDTGSQFSKYSSIIDTKKGTLNFKGKAVVHGSGIDFSTGTTFSISLDEVDTLEELGKGNYGTVWRVRHARPKMRRPGQGLRGNISRSMTSSSISSEDSNTGSPTGGPNGGTTGLVMAMKETRLELDDAKFASIIMELDILHRCLSPFIVSFYGAFFQEGSVYICMEHMDGGSVDKLYGDGVPEGVLRKITLSTVMGLKYLKDTHNIIHRDVKPTNILVNTRGQVKICDFGVSGNLVASVAKTNIGCQSYMAPERISGGGMASAGAGGGTYSVQSDIWSLGLTIIESAMGRYPYPPETYNNIFSQLSAIVDGEPPDLPKEGYSEAARDFVRGCLNKIPKMRPTYAVLLRHAWLSPLMKPPTISEDEEAEAVAEAGGDAGGGFDGSHPETFDKEVGDWVKGALEKKKAGKMKSAEKPALHAAPLDTVPGSSLLDRDGNGDAETDEPSKVKPAECKVVDDPKLKIERVTSMDFAAGSTE